MVSFFWVETAYFLKPLKHRQKLSECLEIFVFNNARLTHDGVFTKLSLRSILIGVAPYICKRERE